MNRSVSGRALSGAAWLAVLGWLRVIVSVGSLMVTAWILGPSTLGTFAALGLVIAVAQIPISGGFTESLIQRPQLSDEQIDATAWLVIILGLGLGGAVFAAADILAVWVAATGHGDSLRVLAWSLPFEALSTVPMSLLARRLAFRERGLVLTVALVAGSMVSMVGALVGWGMSALVAGALVRSVVVCVAGLLAARWLPGRFRGLAPMRGLMGFNLGVQFTYLIGHLDRLLPRYAITVLFGPTVLGLYHMARRIEEEMTTLTTSPLVGVAMPACSKLHGDLPALHHLVLTLYRVAALFVTPLLLGAVVLVPTLFEGFLGAAWVAAIPLTQIVLIGGLRTANSAFNTSVMQSVGRPWLPAWTFAAGLVMQLCALAALVPLGAIGAALAYLIRGILIWPLGLYLIRMATGLSIVAQLRAVARPQLAGVLMALSLLPLVYGLEVLLGDGLAPQVRAGIILGSGVLAGAAIYLLTAWWLMPGYRGDLAVVGGHVRQGRLGAALRHLRDLTTRI
ncbi:MAG: oligosaccharide flippase family protein [Burkholderiaceae bacterium]